MALREADEANTAFWGAQRILWEWCVVPFGLKNAPPFFQRQMDRVLRGLPRDASLMTLSSRVKTWRSIYITSKQCLAGSVLHG